ncbi:AMP-binding protein [Streptomyces exfoliatus]|uniref:AMP-binding protein n=1 Tax=Streptomyces exfoliatus TaxID=1905 RepID=UPI000463D3A9|nr:AMP-binding protein [Streptomyces exfoliatus]
MTSLHAAVRRHAETRPAATALVSGARSVGYGELDRRADAWAESLARQGVGPGELVPVLLPRGVDLVVAVLAILKLGSAYAVLDAGWPEQRIREIVEDLDARLIVAGPGSAGVPTGMPVWSVADAPAGLPGPASGFRPADVPESAPACVFFTSGTTGRPKGVVVPHRALSRLVRPGTFARFAEDTVMPMAAALPWDMFSFELWGALLRGGTALIIGEPYLSAQALREGVAAHGVNTVWLTSSLFNMIMDEDPDAFAGLTQLMIGGERLSVPHVRAFVRRHPGVTLLNGYGPAENTALSTTHRIVEADCDRAGGIPVGRPVPGTRIHLLDGEICVSGEGLALRYLSDPALTAARFPEVTVDGRTVRVYRTGDLGEFDDEGVLHYRGRVDRQVKIRGHRVEPAEVERQIERLLPAVRHCRVVARRDDGGAVEALLAFCVPHVPGDALETAAGQLRAALVHYQRPEAVISVPSFPVTGRGKLDERALLELARAHAAPAESWDLPDPSGTEEDPDVLRVARVFAGVLGVDTVPADVAFTELGGTSLGAGRVCARLSTELGRPVPLTRMYEHPTARALAAWLRDTAGTEHADDGAATTGDVPLTPMQSVYLTRHLLDPDDRSAHCLLLWTVEGELDLDALEAAVEDVHRRHEVLGSAYLLDPEPVCRPVDAPGPVLEVLAAAPDRETAVELLRETLAEPLEITEGDVWRTVLVPLDGASPTSGHVLGCVVHHIAFDGGSESILAADLAEAYGERVRTGQASARPKAPTAAMTHRLRTERLALADVDGQRQWLIEELTGVPEVNWPGFPATGEKVPPGRCEVTLEREVVARLDRAAARFGVTRFTLLLSRYGRLLADLTGGEDFAVGIPASQRQDGDLESAVGCHIDMACIRLRGAALGADPEAVAATARTVDRSFAAQDLAFDEVVRLVNPPRTGRAPLFQTLFVLQDNPVPELPLDGLTTEFVRPRYLEVPLEVQTEVWPLADGRLRLVVNHRPDAVPHDVAHSLAKGLAELLRTIPSGDRS